MYKPLATHVQKAAEKCEPYDRWIYLLSFQIDPTSTVQANQRKPIIANTKD